MQGVHLRKYGVEATIDFEVYGITGVDLKADWVPANADCEIMKDGGAPTACTNTAVDEGSTFSIVLTATEMQAARLVLKVVDAATKVILDKVLVIETYGNASAQHAFDLDTASVAQTGDSYARLGAPAGASVSADIADVPTVSEFNARTLVAASYFDPTTDDVFLGNGAHGGAAATFTLLDYSSFLADVSDLPTNSEFNARTLAAADYFDWTTDEVEISSNSAGIVWDVPLTGASHNGATTSGRRLRQVGSNTLSDGTAQGGGVNTIILEAGESSTDRIYWQSYIVIAVGTGAGQGHHILTYNGTTKEVVIDDDWVVEPDATSEYVIFGAGSHDEIESGLAQAGAAGTITLESAAVAIDDTLNDTFISIVSGTGAHQVRRITAYNGTTKVATVSPNWTTNPDATSGYWVTPQGRPNVWDEPLSKASHNVGQSGAKMLRETGTQIAVEGSVSGTPTTTVFTTNITGYDDDFFVDQVVAAYNGAAQAGQGRVVTGYNGTTGVFTVSEPFTTALVSGDDIIVYTMHVHDVTGIQAGLATSAALAIVDGNVDSVLVDTTEIGVAGAGLGDLGGMSTAMIAEVVAAVISALDTALPGSPTAGSANEVLKNQSRSAATIIDGAASGGSHSTTEMNTDQTFGVVGQVNGRIIIFAADTTTSGLRGLAVDITATATDGKLTFPAIPVAPSDGDTFSIV